jgi:hypothetical protein
MKQLDDLSKWDPASERVPLALNDALKTARNWAIEQEGHGELFLSNVLLRSIDPGDGTLNRLFYYRFTFEILPFDRVVCIVLPDGTVLNPD